MNLSSDILIGICAGLLISTLIAVAIISFQLKIKPWLEARKARGREGLSGIWKTTIDYEGASDDLKFQLEQNVSDISGKLIITKKCQYGNIFNKKQINLNGEFVSDHLMLIGLDKNDTQSHHACFVLKHANSKLKGYSIWVNTGEDSSEISPRYIEIEA